MPTQQLLNLQDQTITDRCRLQSSRRSSAIAEQPALRGKRLEAYTIITRLGPRGATMREVACLAGRGINCWTQPFMDLRRMGLIETTNERRDGGVVHVAKESFGKFVESVRIASGKAWDGVDVQVELKEIRGS